MDKYLFTDGTSGVKEVQSADELKALVQACNDPSTIRIWKFNTSEWVSYTDLAKSFALRTEVETNLINPVHTNGNGIALPVKRRTFRLREIFYIILAVGAGFLLYNFTKIKWEKAGTYSTTAARPANSQALDVDSLIQTIETLRGQSLDKYTRINFRLRNTWPDKISLKLSAEFFTNRSTNRYSNIELSIDNSTGYNLDNAVVQLNTWKKVADSFKIEKIDTVQFSNIGYVLPMKRKLDNSYKGDSISVSFFSIKAKSFNFCYAADKESNYGNMNDRWFWNLQTP